MTRSQTSPFALAAALAALLCLPGPFASVAGADDVSAPTPRRFTRVPAPGGIQIRRFNKTDGPKPEKNDRVIVHYHGTLANGKVFDSSMDRRRPAQFRLVGVIPCWQEALPRLRVGERAEIICPADVAYGAKGSPPDIPGFARLTFQIELLGIQ